jgi:hypothetical protein
LTNSSLFKNVVDPFVSWAWVSPKVGETFREAFEEVRSSSNLAPFGDKFSEEEETEEESQMIGLQWEWCSGKSGIVVLYRRGCLDNIIESSSNIVKNMVWPLLAIRNSTVEVF